MSLLLCIKFERANNWHLMETHARYGISLSRVSVSLPEEPPQITLETLGLDLHHPR